MARRKSKLTEVHEDILVDEMIPEHQHRKWLRTVAAAIWGKWTAGATAAWALFELVRSLWPMGGGGGTP